MNSVEPIINIANLKKKYKQDNGDFITVLKDINLRVNPGEMLAIMGPSGSGKSTLLFILGLFLSPSEGTYLYEGENVLAYDRAAQSYFRRNKMGFVFQSTDLLENSTVYENLEFPLIYSKIKRRHRMERIKEALSKVNLDHRVHHPANRLSGGEKQRVAVARALVNNPPVILADEPTGQLDKDNSKAVMDHFRKITRESDTAMILVTHDAQVGDRCDRVYIMDDGFLTEK